MMGFRIGLVAGLGLLGSLALADVTVVSTMTSTGMTAQPTRVVKAMYKGDAVRMESEDGVWIMDTATGKTFMLKPKDKTYTEFTMAGALPGSESIFKNLKVKTTAKVTPTNEHRTIAGKPADKYVGNVQMTLTSDQMPGVTQKMAMKMETWTTSAVPMTITADKMAKVFGQMFAGLGQFGDMSTLLGEFSKIKGLPLSSNTSMTMSFAEPGANGKKPVSHSMTMGYVIETQSVTEGDLDPALFQVPAGYTLSTKPLVQRP